MLASPGSEWVLKMGPLQRQNSAGSRELSESGAKQMLLEDATQLLKAVSELKLQLLKGTVCATGCGAPDLIQETPDVELHSFQLPNGSWFSLATSNAFGLKVVCKKA